MGDWTDVSFRFREAGSTSTREISLNVNGAIATFPRISDLDGHVFNAGTDNEITASVLSQAQGNQLMGIVKLTGIVQNISIGAEALTIDDLCGTQQPAPIMIDSKVVSVEQTAPNEITYVWDIEALNVQDSDFLIRRSSNLSSFTGYSGSQLSVSPLGAGTDLYRVTEIQPIDELKRFYQVRLRAF